MEIFYLFLLFEVGHGHRLIRDVTMFSERRSSDERNSDEGKVITCLSGQLKELVI